MSGRRLAAVALVAVALAVAAWLAREAGSPAPAEPPPPVPAASLQGGESAPPAAARDPFRYADRAPSAGVAARVPAPVVAAPTTPGPPTPAPVRLLGFVRRPDGLRAALGAAGEVWVVGVGETVAGYAVLEVDEESGVRLRGADGYELRLGPPS